MRGKGVFKKQTINFPGDDKSGKEPVWTIIGEITWMGGDAVMVYLLASWLRLHLVQLIS